MCGCTALDGALGTVQQYRGCCNIAVWGSIRLAGLGSGGGAVVVLGLWGSIRGCGSVGAVGQYSGLCHSIVVAVLVGR